MANVQTSLPIPTQPWEAAKKRFLENLHQEEIHKFNNASLENLFYEASVAQRKHAQGSKTWILQQRLASLVDGIQEYGQALDVYSNTSALILCPIWGSIRVVIHIASEAGKFQEKIVDMLAQIGDVLPRFGIYQTLFSDHERILVALSDAYLDVLQFCVQTKNFFLQSRKSLVPMSIILKGAWKPFRQDFEENMIRFRKHQKAVEKEARLAHMIEAAKARDLEKARQALQIRNNKFKRRHRILCALRTVDYQAKHVKLSALRHPGTNVWLRHDSHFKSWLASNVSSCLPCYGIPGSGKSVLAANVSNDLAASLDPSSVLCYYYCDYSDANSLDPNYFLASLIKQATLRLPLDHFTDKFHCPYDEQIPPPLLAKARTFLSDILKNFKTAYVVVDGLDELHGDGQRAIMDTLTQLLQLTPTIVKCFITSRPEEYVVKNAWKRCQSIVLSSTQLDQDIASFIEDTINSQLVKSNPLFNNEILKKEVFEALVAGAQCMFLWVKFQLYDLEEALTENAVRTILADLPKNLGETYHRIIKKACRYGGQEKSSIIKRVLHWTICARRPLLLEEIEEAVALDKSDTYLRADRISGNTGDRLVSACGNLVVYNRDDNTVSLAHHTVKQYLCQEPGEYAQQDTSAFHFDLLAAHREIGEICISYLSFSDFETQVIKVPQAVEVPSEGLKNMIWSGVPFARYAQSLFWREAQGRPTETATQPKSRLAVPVSTKPSATMAKKYALLDYVITFWPFHTASFTEDSPGWSAFARVALHQQLLFAFRPWEEEQHRDKVDSVLKTNDSPQSSRGMIESLRQTKHPLTAEYRNTVYLYAWAFKNGLGSLLRLSNNKCLGTYFQERYRVQYDWNAIIELTARSLTTCIVPSPLDPWDVQVILSIVSDEFWSEPWAIEILEYEFRSWVDQDQHSFDVLFIKVIDDVTRIWAGLGNIPGLSFIISKAQTMGLLSIVLQIYQERWERRTFEQSLRDHLLAKAMKRADRETVGVAILSAMINVAVESRDIEALEETLLLPLPGNIVARALDDLDYETLFHDTWSQVSNKVVSRLLMEAKNRSRRHRRTHNVVSSH